MIMNHSLFLLLQNVKIFKKVAASPAEDPFPCLNMFVVVLVMRYCGAVGLITSADDFISKKI